MRQSKYNDGQWLLYAAITVAIVASICIATGCNTLEKATERVILNPEARHKVWAIQSELTPCVRDSFVQFIEGDTLTVTDTVTLNHTDTVDNFYHYTDTVKITKRITNRDTLILKIRDKADKDSLVSKSAQIWGLKSVISVKDEEIKAEHKRGWIFIAIIAGLCVVFGLIIKFKLP